jgi:hypothetical protein
VGADVDGLTTPLLVALVCPPPMHAVRTTPEARAATGRSGKRTRRFYDFIDQRTSFPASRVFLAPRRISLNR